MSKKKKEIIDRPFSSVDHAYVLVQERVELFLPQVADAMFDCIICDPAYDSQDEHRKIGTTTRLKNWFETLPIEAFGGIFAELHRVLKNNHHMYVFCDTSTSRHFQDIAQKVGFTFGNELVWNTVTMSTGYNWRPQTQRILFLKKGKKPRQLHDKTIAATDLLTYPAVRGDGSYPTEKPVGLCEKLILNSVDPGAIIFSPFAGSAPEGLAALRNHMQYVGVDIEDTAIKRADDRLGDFVEAGTDFFAKFGFAEE